jgi:hypothetical protein
MTRVSIENIGPIDRAQFNFEPGLTVIEGAPGTGKTTALETINLVVNGQKSSRITRRDGANRGQAEVDGKIVRISKTMRTEGELRVEGLGEFSIASLHRPPFKTAATCDRHRIQALAVIAGAKLERESFYHLLGGKADFADVVSSRAFESDDPVEITSRVKGAIEEECRRVEKLERSATESAKAQLELSEEVDTELPHNEATLQRDLEVAIREHSRVKEKREAWMRTVKAAEAARSRLAELPPGKSVAEAQKFFEGASQSYEEKRTVVANLEARLAEAQADLKYEAASMLSAERELESAKRDVALRGELDAAIEAAGGAVETTENELDDAAEAVGEARQASKVGMQVRQAIEAKAKAQTHLDKAKDFREKAERLRNAAAGTFDVLSESIAKIEDCPLRVHLTEDNEPRLVVETDRSEREYFSELSDGEQLDVIMRIATRHNRLIPMSQGEFGELSPGLRDKLHELAVRHGAYIVTAVATDGELSARAYSTVRVEAAE